MLLADILMLLFAGLVAIGVTGEVFAPSQGFGRFAAAGVDGEALLGFASFLLNRRLRALQDLEIAALGRDLAEARRSTEQERLARVKLEERLAPRYITEENQHRVVAVLRPEAMTGRLVDLIKCPNDAEVDALVRQLFGLLTEAGWKPAVYTASSDDPFLGITVWVNPNNAPSIRAGKVLISAMAIAGLSAMGPDLTLPKRMLPDQAHRDTISRALPFRLQLAGSNIQSTAGSRPSIRLGVKIT